MQAHRRIAADLKNEPVIRDRPAFDRAAIGDRCTSRFRLAQKAQHQAMAVDDAGRGRQQGGAGLQVRLQGLDRVGAEPFQIADAVRLGQRLDLLQGRDLVRRAGDDQLAQTLMGNAAAGAIGIELFAAGKAQPRFQASGRIIDPGMNDFAVARGDFAAEGRILLQDQDLAARQAERAGNCQADDSSADDDGLDRFRHGSGTWAAAVAGSVFRPCSFVSRCTM